MNEIGVLHKWRHEYSLDFLIPLYFFILFFSKLYVMLSQYLLTPPL